MKRIAYLCLIFFAFHAKSQTVISTGTFSTCSAILVTPNYPNAYPKSFSYTQTINPSSPGSVVQINFPVFNAGAADGNEVFAVYDGPNTNSPVIVNKNSNFYLWASGNAPIFTAQNATGALTIYFQRTSTAATSPSGNYGFSGNISCVSRIGCDGTISSPNFPANYPINSSSTRLISNTSNAKRTRLEFNSFTVSPNTAVVKVYDGLTTNGPLIGAYNGSELPNSITSSDPSGALTVAFNASTTVGFWSGKVSCHTIPSAVFSNTTTSSCNLVLTSSGYPQGYTSNYNATYLYSTYFPSTPGTKLKLTFNTTQIDTDVIRIYDGSNTSATAINYITGNAKPSPIFSTNTAGSLTIAFQISSYSPSQPVKFWSAVLECTTTPPPAPLVNISTTNRTVNCYTGLSLASPNYPSAYPNNSNFTTVLTPSDPNETLQISFSKFATQQTYDVVTIYNGTTTSAPVLAQLSGNSVPSNSYSATNANGALTIRFSSDGSTNGSGWLSNINCISRSVITDLKPDEEGFHGNISIVPNPVSGTFDIINPIPNEVLRQFEITNLQGRLVKEGKLIGTKPGVDVSDLSAGIYILHVFTDSKVSYLRLIKD